mmetsp:Transcript_29237/g.74131  ORF Transcript_29237/g.74131 Transcript_29237/m.74131 type:complete len:222 (-) Transcript_29237:940-1605(-)
MVNKTTWEFSLEVCAQRCVLSGNASRESLLRRAVVSSIFQTALFGRLCCDLVIEGVGHHALGGGNGHRHPEAEEVHDAECKASQERVAQVQWRGIEQPRPIWARFLDAPPELGIGHLEAQRNHGCRDGGRAEDHVAPTGGLVNELVHAAQILQKTKHDELQEERDHHVQHHDAYHCVRVHQPHDVGQAGQEHLPKANHATLGVPTLMHKQQRQHRKEVARV